eukprot:CAMPEP_0198283044 /NCGR_PEP_ID=MMETSP1449-20131203/2719_1 /TAXON_ID=420275 /ORGANISM="Attheya septentrionalis, Strain CCMP2084" /LENGTH=256 /DNA_ID=CAMNT_0043979499 /DNA_START=203 /DNA_END=973 /DNA_ORIENTATION=+
MNTSLVGKRGETKALLITEYGTVRLFPQSDLSATALTPYRLQWVRFLVGVSMCICFSFAVISYMREPQQVDVDAYDRMDASFRGGNHRQRTLILLRHAKSSWDDPSLDDEQRPLSKEGIRAAERLGMYLQETGVDIPEFIISSPSVRTRSTLALVRKYWGIRNDLPIQFEERLYDLANSTYRNFVSQLPPSYTRVMLVAHNSAIGDLALQLLPNDSIQKKFPPGTFCEIECANTSWTMLEDGKGKMIEFISPKDTQ